MIPNEVAEAITELVQAGAEWEIREADETVLRWDALARHWRAEQDKVIVRPLERPRRRQDGRPVFLLNESSPAYVRVSAIKVLPNGTIGMKPADFDGFAVIRPVSAVHAATLEQWDDFYENVLTSEEREDVDALVLGEWYGNWA